ncbi:MAG TPA: mercuric reductase [Longimicrobiaceae bacterium]|nr:mercuric reductase [Longimicrobiaceae bacterium]
MASITSRSVQMDVDVIVIGSGQAGVPLATRLARDGKRVVLAERDQPGGTCVNYGCTPTKTMMASAQAAHDARRAASLGVDVGEVRVDLSRVVARKDAMVHEWRASVEKSIAGAGERLTLVRAHARFTGERQVEMGGATYRAETVIVNTGARPAVPPLDGLDGVPWLDNRRVMELTELPVHLLVLGGGYVGCEFAQMFRRFGSRVTIVGSAAHLLDREDADVSEAVQDAFGAEGIEMVLGASAKSVARDGAGVRLRLEDGREMEGSHLLVAVGRKPNTDDLGCEAAGIRLTERGAIEVDDRFATSAEGVYAVGDVTGGPQFTHTAWDDGRILFDLLQGTGRRTAAGRTIPYAVFTDPQVARAGLSETDARKDGVAYELATMPFSAIARAWETGRSAGMMKLLLDPQTERILGVTIVGAEAGELLHAFVPLMQSGTSARAIVDAEFVHPTFAEGVQSLVMRLPRYKLS